MDRDLLEQRAFEIFLKRMPSMPLTESSMSGFKSAAEQAVEIAQMFKQAVNDTLYEQNRKQRDEAL